MSAANSMAAFASVSERAGATSKRLAKGAILADYLAALDDESLPIACRFLSGNPFPTADQRVLQVGGSAISGLIATVSGLSLDAVNNTLVRLGDYGEVAEQAFTAASHQPEGAPLSLTETMAAYAEIAATSGKGGPGRKAAILEGLLRRADPLVAKYLLKIVTNELRTGLRESMVEDALARLSGLKVAELQRVNMLLGDIGAVALRARHGTLGEAQMVLFQPLKSMLASPVEKPGDVLKEAEPTVIVEDKYDGVRVQAHKVGERVELYSRTLDLVTHRFPEVVTALAALPGDFILDGEVVAYAGGVFLPFSLLQQRLGRKQVTDEMLANIPVIFVAFDLLYNDGAVLLDQPLRERWAGLVRLLSGAAAGLRLAEHDEPTREQLGPQAEELDRYFLAARARGNEGLMIKLPSSLYAPGKRGKTWLKVKKALATLDVVVTAVEWGYGRRHTVLSDYTFAVQGADGALLNVGKAYSGLTDAEIAELTEWFKAHTLQEFAHGKVRLVEPKIVIEIAFDRVQRSPRHKSGFALRFPRIIRLREDKPVSEINTLEDVRKLADDEQESGAS